jgi:hypothetical protein
MPEPPPSQQSSDDRRLLEGYFMLTMPTLG